MMQRLPRIMKPDSKKKEKELDEIPYVDKEHGETILKLKSFTDTYGSPKKHTGGIVTSIFIYIYNEVYIVHTSQQESLRLKTLAHIEEVLDTLNTHADSMTNFANAPPPGPNEQKYLKTFAKPTKQIKGLVNMINNVADELDLY